MAVYHSDSLQVRVDYCTANELHTSFLQIFRDGMRKDISQMAISQDGVQQIHGFFVDEEVIAFDIVVSFDHDASAISHILKEQITKKYPGKNIQITIDTNYSE